jgi:KDO2-lipid IV(A) lauroyltransferase
MPRFVRRAKAGLRAALKPGFEAALGGIAVLALRGIRLFDADRTARFTGGMLRRIGPLLPEHRTGRANLTAAFPEKSPTEIDTILGDVWENLGRFAAEFAHLDHIWDFDPERPNQGRIEVDAATAERFQTLLHDGKGALIFASHLGNWELPALAGPAYDLESAALFRRPNIAAVDRAVQKIRSVNMGEMIATTRDAPMRIADAIAQGKHVGMLVDQYFTKGVDVTFFGRTTKANPLLARLARQIDCPIYGVRIVRLPGHRFRAELSEELIPVRAADGAVDIQGTTQKIMAVIEGWVREHPEQWLWLHRRWR